MKRKIFKISLLSCLAILAVLCCAEDAEKAKRVEVTASEIGSRAFCPVTADSFTVHEQTPVIQYKGTRYYMCCPGCATEFMKEPDKYMTHMETAAHHKPMADEDMIGAEIVCPVSGDRFHVSETTPVVEYEGEKYYVCCPGCEREFKKDPEKYIELMERQPEE